MDDEGNCVRERERDSEISSWENEFRECWMGDWKEVMMRDER